MNRDPLGPAENSDASSSTELVRILTGMDASAGLAIAQRARRAVRETAVRLSEERKRSRRTKGLALLLFMAFFTLITPALWSGVDELFAGEHLSDLPTMFTLFALTLFSAVVAALIASWRSNQTLRYQRRNF